MCEYMFELAMIEGPPIDGEDFFSYYPPRSGKWCGCFSRDEDMHYDHQDRALEAVKEPAKKPEPDRLPKEPFDWVPDALVEEAVEAWHAMPRPLGLDDQMRFILAAVLPAYRQTVLAEETHD